MNKLTKKQKEEIINLLNETIIKKKGKSYIKVPKLTAKKRLAKLRKDIRSSRAQSLQLAKIKRIGKRREEIQRLKEDINRSFESPYINAKLDNIKNQANELFNKLNDIQADPDASPSEIYKLTSKILKIKNDFEEQENKIEAEEKRNLEKIQSKKELEDLLTISIDPAISELQTGRKEMKDIQQSIADSYKDITKIKADEEQQRLENIKKGKEYLKTLARSQQYNELRQIIGEKIKKGRATNPLPDFFKKYLDKKEELNKKLEVIGIEADILQPTESQTQVPQTQVPPPIESGKLETPESSADIQQKLELDNILATQANAIITGEGLRFNQNSPGVLSNLDIEKYLAPLYKYGFLGCMFSDQISEIPAKFLPKEGGICINSHPEKDKNNNQNPGQHWISLYWNLNDIDENDYDIDPDYDYNGIYYYDPYGLPPSDALLYHIKILIKKIMDKFNLDYQPLFEFNRWQEQSYNSSYCGWHNIRFLLDSFNGLPNIQDTIEESEEMARNLQDQYEKK